MKPSTAILINNQNNLDNIRKLMTFPVWHKLRGVEFFILDNNCSPNQESYQLAQRASLVINLDKVDYSLNTAASNNYLLRRFELTNFDQILILDPSDLPKNQDLQKTLLHKSDKVLGFGNRSDKLCQLTYGAFNKGLFATSNDHINFLNTSHVLIPTRLVLNKKILFDERLFLGLEMVDWTYRLWKSGVQLSSVPASTPNVSSSCVHCLRLYFFVRNRIWIRPKQRFLPSLRTVTLISLQLILLTYKTRSANKWSCFARGLLDGLRLPPKYPTSTS